MYGRSRFGPRHNSQGKVPHSRTSADSRGGRPTHRVAGKITAEQPTAAYIDGFGDDTEA